jgi:hypothetical protein
MRYGRAAAPRLYPDRYLSGAGREYRTGCRCTRTPAWDLVAAGLGLRRACMWQTPVCSCGRAGWREAPITRPGASGMLITGRPFRGCRLGGSMGPPACGSFFFSSRVRSATGTGRAAARRRAVADLSKRTRRAATVRLGCRHMHPQCAQPRGGSADSAMLTDFSSNFTSRPCPARGNLIAGDPG